jgi:predicted N-acetyltransferase YhbS
VLQAKTVSDVLFIHDLAVSPAGRGWRLGETLVACVLAAATRDGLKHAELIAVAGAASYGRTLGFAEAAASADLARKVSAYGPDAKWMSS